ncbi:flippase activity-associated protein Agl23 [Planctomycetota bacterium]
MKRYLFICAIVLTVAAALRLPQLSLRPMHTDEAVHAVKFGELLEEGQYRYDPYEYHGPTLYYLTLFTAWLSGAHNLSELTEHTLRIITAIFGVGTILFFLLLADGLGRTAAFFGALLTAISPVMVFYSRYYIHETLLVFFSFLVIAAAWRYRQSNSVGWLLLAGAGIGFIHATKETCIIVYGAMVASLLLCRIGKGQNEILRGAQNGTSSPNDDKVKKGKTGSIIKGKHLIAALLVGMVVSFLLYSSFFTNLQGPRDSLRTYATYLGRADGRGVHDHPWYYYLKMLIYTKDAPGPWWSEGLIMVLALVGFMAAIIGKGIAKSNIRLLRFIAFYTLMMTAAYSIIPYKTPWCMLGFLHGMIILAGVGAVVLVRMMPIMSGRVIISLLLIAGAFHLTHQAYRANFRFFADQRNPYVYAHTVSDVKRLAGLIQDIASAYPAGNDLPIKVIAEADNYWPLPWYLRKFPQTGYWRQAPQDVNEPLVIVGPVWQPSIEEKLEGAYHPEYYGLRPTVQLKVFIRNDLWEAFIKQQQIKN